MINITENQSIATFTETASIHEILTQAAQSGIVIDMIAQLPSATQIDLAFTFADEALPAFLKIVSEHKKSVSSNNTKIAIKSAEMITGTGFAAKVFAILNELDCSPLLITTGLDEISLLVHKNCAEELSQRFHANFT